MARISGWAAMAPAALILAGCAGGPGCRDPKLGVCPSPRVVKPGEPVPKGGGRYLVGKPYVIGGRLYRPREDPDYNAVGTASWYGDAFHGRLTANGEVFDSASFSAAHPTLPIPSYVRVTNLANGRAMVVRVNDRGPYHSNRLIDVSSRVADALGFQGRGLAHVRVEYLRPARLDGQDDWLAATLTKKGRPIRNVAVASAPTKETKRRRIASARADEKTASASRPRIAAPRDEPMDVSPPQDIVPPFKFARAGAPADGPPLQLAAPPAERAPQVENAAKLYLQAGSYRDPRNAERLAERLASLGPVDVSRRAAKGGTWYHVRVGPLAPGAASKAVRLAEEAGVVGARVAEF